MNTKRQDEILKIIQNNEVYTQENLLELLKKSGFKVTQATVSRDIKILDLVKTITESGKYKYSKSSEHYEKIIATKFRAVFMEAVISVDYAINTVVIKCHVGMANAACAALDTMEQNYNVVGTLAGDDTIFILLRNENDAKNYAEKISNLLKK
ncbi:MAG: arginine repressor [Oscillospiraceae bacterium]